MVFKLRVLEPFKYVKPADPFPGTILSHFLWLIQNILSVNRWWRSLSSRSSHKSFQTRVDQVSIVCGLFSCTSCGVSNCVWIRPYFCDSPTRLTGRWKPIICLSIYLGQPYSVCLGIALANVGPWPFSVLGQASMLHFELCINGSLI